VGRKSAPCSTCPPAGTAPNEEPAHSLRGQGLRNPAAPSLSASQVFIAVSDPDGTGPTRNFGFPWKPEEERTLKAKTIALAEAEVAKYVAKYRAGRAGTPVAATTKPAARSTKAKDGRREKALRRQSTSKTSRSPATISGSTTTVELVVTATSGDNLRHPRCAHRPRVHPAEALLVVTDKDHLDAIPRLELVGPIDADGKGKAELLFRIVGDGNVSLRPLPRHARQHGRALAQRRLRE